MPQRWLAMLVVCFSTGAVAQDSVDPALRTVAERSGYAATSRYAEVVALLETIDARSSITRLISMGRSVEGRPIPVMVIADPPLATPAEARASGKLVLFAFGNIHAGEVCGKEALLRLAREFALDPEAPGRRAILDEAILLIAPIYNADGNERFDRSNRPGQNGPAEGMGQRPNAQGLDLNRDYIKLESPEARSMVSFLNAWNPAVIIDTHTTNGSYHQFTLTFEAPLNPSGHPAPIDYARNEFLPEVSRRVEAETGYKSFFYGNFDRERTGWYTYDSRPRFGGPYAGLRNRIGILTEAYAYATYKDRILSTHAFVLDAFALAVEQADQIRAVIEQADRETTAAGAAAAPDDLVGLRHEWAAWERPVIIPGYVEVEGENGRPRPTEEKLDRKVAHFGRFIPTLTVRRPLGYLIPPERTNVLENLRLHGVRLERVTAATPVMIERATIETVNRNEREFQGHRNVLVDVSRESEVFSPPVGWWYASTAQPLGSLLVYLLEPDSADGLVSWNFFDDRIQAGATYPILRVLPENSPAEPG
jgi:hypothetical protein